MKVIHGRVPSAGSQSGDRRTFTGEVWADPVLAADRRSHHQQRVLRAPARGPTGTPTTEARSSRARRPREDLRATVARSSRSGPGDVVWISPDERHWHGAAEQLHDPHRCVARRSRLAGAGQRRGLRTGAPAMSGGDGDVGRYERGLQMRREVLGAEHVDRSLQTASDFSRPVQEFVTEYCWGAVWTRERTRPAHTQPAEPGDADGSQPQS